MKYCKTCLYPSTKPDLWFDEDGICGACKSFSKRKTRNWETLAQEFYNILKSSSHPYFDCVIPVSGGKDSLYQVWKVKESGLNPLCVTAPTDLMTPVGRRNISNLQGLGVDHIEVTVNPVFRKKIAKKSLETIGDIQWAEHLLINTIPIRIALNFGINIIVRGECPQREYGAGRPEDQELTFFSRRVLEEYGNLNGQRVSDLEILVGAKKRELYFFEYPDEDQLDALNLKMIYLDNYYPWHGVGNLTVALSNGLETFPTSQPGTLGNYENLDNYVHGIHDYLKYLKYGFSRATDVACNLIRRELLSRADAISLVAQTDGQYPSFYFDKSLEQILTFFSLTEGEFGKICDDFTNTDLFETELDGSIRKDNHGNVIPKFSVGQA